MALKLLQSGNQPLGQFDGLDTQVLSLKGGEVVTFGSVLATTATDSAAKDSFDGYVGPTAVNRVVVRLPTAGTERPLMLADEGISGYGTLFGSVVGGTVGQTSFGPLSTIPAAAKLGPHTATGSGKVTCWEKPGLYAVSLDACDTTVTTGLQPSNGALATGAALYVTSTGLLTPTSASALGGNTASLCGRFVDFETNGSLVTTPNRLVAALNSPSGIVSSVVASTYAFATFYFNPSA